YPPAHFALGTELAALEQSDEAIEQLTVYINDDPDNFNRIPARTLRGRLFAAKGRLDDARNEYATLVKLSPSMLDAQASLGDVLMMQRKYGDAIGPYQEFLKLRPNDARIRFQLGLALASSGRMAEAIDAYQQAINVEPRLTIARLSLAEIYMRLGRA